MSKKLSKAQADVLCKLSDGGYDLVRVRSRHRHAIPTRGYYTAERWELRGGGVFGNDIATVNRNTVHALLDSGLICGQGRGCFALTDKGREALAQ